MILTDFCARHQSRLANADKSFGCFAVSVALLSRGYFGANFIQRFRGNSRGQFINQSLAVSQFRFENLAAHRLACDFKEFLDRHNLGFLVELPPKNFQRIL